MKTNFRNEAITMALEIKNGYSNAENVENLCNELFSDMYIRYKELSSECSEEYLAEFWYELDAQVREEFGILEPIFLESNYHLGDANEEVLAEEAAEFYINHTINILPKIGSMNDDVLSESSVLNTLYNVIYKGYPISTSESFFVIYKDEVIKLDRISSETAEEPAVFYNQNKKLKMEYSDKDLYFHFTQK